jgi:hypothetical protein
VTGGRNKRTPKAAESAQDKAAGAAISDIHASDGLPIKLSGPAQSFSESVRIWRAGMGLLPARTLIVPPALVKLVRLKLGPVLRFRSPRRAGNFSEQLPAWTIDEIAAHTRKLYGHANRADRAKANKLLRLDRLAANRPKGTAETRINGMATEEMVRMLADTLRVAGKHERNIASIIASRKVIKVRRNGSEKPISTSQVRRILAKRKARMTEKG